MDNPATKPGQYKLKKTGKLITPDTHREIRHNPPDVARALSGNGKANRNIQTIAKIHTLADKGYSPSEIKQKILKRRKSKTIDKGKGKKS